ncbi:hypothetical protein AB0N56_11210 [Streptomyces microflavus]|nr:MULTISPECIES: hypothetical protein [unclassified Streptomyces]QTA30028.1 hypothetical protein JHY03_01440 [Streptomyces sp. CA-256286]
MTMGTTPDPGKRPRAELQPRAEPRSARAEPVAEHPEITYIGCARCGTQIAGLDGRYACSGCGWVNEWTEGHRPLPAAGRRRPQPAPRPQQP